MEAAIISWFETVYYPIIVTIQKQKVMKSFKKQTISDLYVWIVRYWDSLKQNFGENISIEKAVQDFGKYYQLPLYKRIKNFFTRIVLRRAISINSADNYIKLDD